MRFDSGQLTELIDQTRWERSPQLLLAPIMALPSGHILPHVWRELLMQQDAHKQVARLLWTGVADVLPRVVATIEEKLQAVGLLTTELKGSSLVYIFSKSGEIFARRGYLPVEKLPTVSSRLSIDLSAIYRIHNGWVDLFSADTGPLPVEEWQVLGLSQSDRQEGFLEVFTAGGNALGFDLSEDPAGSYLVSADEDVSRVDDFFWRLDSWISGELQEMDGNTD